MVLLGLLAVIVVIVLIVVRPGTAAGGQKLDADSAQTSSETPAADAPAATSTAPAGADGACAPEQIAVEAITDAADYSAEQQPALSISVTNTGASACTLDVGTSAQVFTVQSGEDVYWTSTDCQTDSSAIPLELTPGQTVQSAEPTVWDRTRSAVDTCEGVERPVAPAGGASYHLSVSIDGIPSASSKQFILN